MQELIHIASRLVGPSHVQTVNARDLHEFLGVGKTFAAWMPERIEQFGFLEHVDFEVFSESGNNPQGGRPSKDYALTLSMAKELAMVERNDKGKQARIYFIECERRATDPIQNLLTMPRTDMLELALGLSRERDALRSQAQQAQATIATLEPKALALERISTAKGSMCITDAAKTLRVKPTFLFAWLHEHRWIYRRPGGGSWVAMQDRLDLGFLEQPLLTISHPDRPDRVKEHLKVTPRGLAHLGQLLSKVAS